MKNKIVLSESEKSKIKKMYGILNEQQYMKNYSGNLLDFCGYRAIEQFEETMGTPSGKSMGDDYFENEVKNYEQLISTNIQNTIGLSVFLKFPPKLRMQIWSFMFNSTDASNGTVKWLSGLSQAINKDKFLDNKSGQDYRILVSNKNGQEYKNAIDEIINFKEDWNNIYNSYLKVLDQQYISTAINNKKQGSYDNSWKYRPSKLNEFYNNCKGGSQNKITSKTQTNQSQVKNDDNTTKDSNLPRRTTGSVVLEKDAFNKLSKKIQDYSNREFESGEALSVGEFNLSYKNNENKIFVEISTNPSGEKYSKLVLAINDEAKRAQESKGYNLIKSGKIQLPGEFASSNPDGYGWYLFGEPIK